jgi:hypothetical protein
MWYIKNECYPCFITDIHRAVRKFVVEPKKSSWFNDDSFFAAEILIPPKYREMIPVSAQVVSPFINMCSYNLIYRE